MRKKEKHCKNKIKKFPRNNDLYSLRNKEQ